MIKEQLQGVDREQFIIACLNIKNEPTNITVVSVGSLNKAIVHSREVFKTTILSNAASGMTFHNHSSGDTTPSNQDIQITHRLVEVGRVIRNQITGPSHNRRWFFYAIKRKRIFISDDEVREFFRLRFNRN